MASIDTIRFKLDNILKYGELGVNLVKGDKVTTGGMKFRRIGFSFMEQKETEFIKCKLTSASNDVNYDVFLNLNCAVFEFSIPKYIYGHNVYEFPLNEKNQVTEINDFIYLFFLNEFKEEIDLKDIYLLRLDICKNIRYESELQKENFKNALPVKFLDVFNKSKIMVYPEKNTVFYKTENFSFKVYDKKAEFLKHSYKKMCKKLDKNRADKILIESANMLRVEMTLREDKINELFFKNCTSDYWLNSENVSPQYKRIYQRLHKNFLEVKSIQTKIVNRLNNYLGSDFDEIQKLKDELNEIYRESDKKYLKHDFMKLAISAMILRNNGLGFVKPFEESDTNEIISSFAMQQVKEYRKMIAPKSIRLNATDLEKRINYNINQFLIYDDNYHGHILNFFNAKVNEINMNASKEVSSKSVLHYCRKLLSENKISVLAIKKYLIISEKKSDKELCSEKIYSDRQIQRIKKSIKQANELIKMKYPDKDWSIEKVVI